MKALPFLFLGLFSAGASAAGFLEFRDEDFDAKTLKNKRWQMTFGLEYMQYPTSLPGFEGEHETIEEDENYNVFGINLGFGREFRLGGDFSTTMKGGGFYTKTLQESVGKASKDIDLDLSSVRSDHMVYGGEVSASVNYLYENSVLNFQPFVEFGVGSGVGAIEKEYTFDGIQPTQSDAEDYDIKIEESFDYTKMSLGVNFISREGILSFFKLTQMTLAVSERETVGTDGEGPVDEKESNPGNKTLVAASVGFGYKF